MSHRTHPLRADALLLLAAFIWGTSFVAQRAAMEHLGPMTFNGIRFALGGFALLPLWRIGGPTHAPTFSRGRALGSAALSGLILFGGASLQQIGLIYTTAGKAGFITGLYVVLVPFLGLAVGRRAGQAAWIGATVAVVGLYFLSVSGPLRMNPGDLLVLGSALFWAVHILLLDRISPHMRPFQLAALQSLCCAAGSLVVGVVTEPCTLPGIRTAAVPILYSGLISVGIAFSLQIAAQSQAPPAHAAILLSLEAPFAAWAGGWLLGEVLSTRAQFGCALMLAGMLASQLLPLVPPWNSKRP